jgi:hypothetical protein
MGGRKLHELKKLIPSLWKLVWLTVYAVRSVADSMEEGTRYILGRTFVEKQWLLLHFYI